MTPARPLQWKIRSDQPQKRKPDAPKVPRNAEKTSSTAKNIVASKVVSTGHVKTSKRPVLAKKKAWFKSEKILKVATDTLVAFGLPCEAVPRFLCNYSAKKVQALVNFNLACYYGNWQVWWKKQQLLAFFEMLDTLNYSVDTLHEQWFFIKTVASHLRLNLPDSYEERFDLVEANTKELNDDRMPVGCDILIQLIKAAELMLGEYNTTLWKAVLIMAWGACMRIGEYSYTKVHTDHNVWANTINISKKGLSIEFFSDKVSKKTDSVKHHFMRWSLLPGSAKEIIKNYKKMRPTGAKYFFIQKDGRPLWCNHVVDMLDICNLQTTARNLRILPHGLHSGGWARED